MFSTLNYSTYLNFVRPCRKPDCADGNFSDLHSSYPKSNWRNEAFMPMSSQIDPMELTGPLTMFVPDNER